MQTHNAALLNQALGLFLCWSTQVAGCSDRELQPRISHDVNVVCCIHVCIYVTSLDTRQPVLARSWKLNRRCSLKPPRRTALGICIMSYMECCIRYC